jgi:hypothetical protein
MTNLDRVSLIELLMDKHLAVDEVLDVLEACEIEVSQKATHCGYIDCPGIAEPIREQEHGPEHPTCKILQEFWLAVESGIL